MPRNLLADAPPPQPVLHGLERLAAPLLELGLPPELVRRLVAVCGRTGLHPAEVATAAAGELVQALERSDAPDEPPNFVPVVFWPFGYMACPKGGCGGRGSWHALRLDASEEVRFWSCDLCGSQLRWERDADVRLIDSPREEGVPY